MRKSPRKSPEKGDALAHAPTLALLHVTELRRTPMQTWMSKIARESKGISQCESYVQYT